MGEIRLNEPVSSCFNPEIKLPFNLRVKDFEMAMRDVYGFFFDVNKLLVERGLQRFDDMTRKAMMSGFLSDLLTASMAKHSRSLVQNQQFNGHPDLLVGGVYPKNSIKSGTEGMEIKSTLKKGGAVDTHGGRDQWMCVFVYEVDTETEPAISRRPMTFTEIYVSKVTVADFRRNTRGDLGTPTSTLDRQGIAKLREGWVYLLDPAKSKAAKKSN